MREEKKVPLMLEEKERKEKNTSVYLPFRHVSFTVELEGKWKAQRGATKSAVSENYVNIRYCDSHLIGVSLAYICDNVSSVMHRYSCQDAEGKFVSLSHLFSGRCCRRGRVQAH